MLSKKPLSNFDPEYRALAYEGLGEVLTVGRQATYQVPCSPRCVRGVAQRWQLIVIALIPRSETCI
jgi:hypothetical protein